MPEPRLALQCNHKSGRHLVSGCVTLLSVIGRCRDRCTEESSFAALLISRKGNGEREEDREGKENK